MAYDPNLDTTADGRVYVHLEPGDPLTGLWCETCFLPSLISIPVYILGQGGVRLFGHAELCPDCDDEARWIKA